MTPRIRVAWGRRTCAEYRSAALASQLLHWSIALGTPMPLTGRLHALVMDELTHAELSRAVHAECGGSANEVMLTRDELFFRSHADQPLERRALYAVLQEFAMHESVALEVFKLMRGAKLVPVVSYAVARIVRDESRHRTLGWALFGALLNQTADRAWIQASLPSLLNDLTSAYSGAGIASDIERTWGLLDQSEYDRALRRAFQGGVRRNLEKHGIALP